MNNTIDQRDLIDVKRVFHTTAAGYVFFSAARDCVPRWTTDSGLQLRMKTFKSI